MATAAAAAQASGASVVGVAWLLLHRLPLHADHTANDAWLASPARKSSAAAVHAVGTPAQRGRRRPLVPAPSLARPIDLLDWPTAAIFLSRSSQPSVRKRTATARSLPLALSAPRSPQAAPRMFGMGDMLKPEQQRQEQASPGTLLPRSARAPRPEHPTPPSGPCRRPQTRQSCRRAGPSGRRPCCPAPAPRRRRRRRRLRRRNPPYSATRPA